MKSNHAIKYVENVVIMMMLPGGHRGPQRGKPRGTTESNGRPRLGHRFGGRHSTYWTVEKIWRTLSDKLFRENSKFPKIQKI